jgi:methylglutaconyl-CoA hydratase
VFNLRRIFNDVMNLPFPVLCLMDGIALGGGLELALNTDIRVTTKNTLIGLTETSWSLLPGGGGTQNLARLIGVGKAKELIYTSRKINGEEALKLGIVNHCENTYEEAEKRVYSIIDEMLPNGPIGIKYAKKAINWGMNTDLRTGLEIERMNYEKVVHSEDRVEGFKAFAEKRKPVYKNK